MQHILRVNVDAPNAKFKVGQWVKVTHPNGTWTGHVWGSAKQDDLIEYEVTNGPEFLPGVGFPLLVWEDQIEPA